MDIHIKEESIDDDSNSTIDKNSQKLFENVKIKDEKIDDEKLIKIDTNTSSSHGEFIKLDNRTIIRKNINIQSVVSSHGSEKRNFARKSTTIGSVLLLHNQTPLNDQPTISKVHQNYSIFSHDPDEPPTKRQKIIEDEKCPQENISYTEVPVNDEFNPNEDCQSSDQAHNNEIEVKEENIWNIEDETLIKQEEVQNYSDFPINYDIISESHQINSKSHEINSKISQSHQKTPKIQIILSKSLQVPQKRFLIAQNISKPKEALKSDSKMPKIFKNAPKVSINHQQSEKVLNLPKPPPKVVFARGKTDQVNKIINSDLNSHRDVMMRHKIEYKTSLNSQESTKNQKVIKIVRKVPKIVGIGSKSSLDMPKNSQILSHNSQSEPIYSQWVIKTPPSTVNVAQGFNKFSSENHTPKRVCTSELLKKAIVRQSQNFGGNNLKIVGVKGQSDEIWQNSSEKQKDLDELSKDPEKSSNVEILKENSKFWATDALKILKERQKSIEVLEIDNRRVEKLIEDRKNVFKELRRRKKLKRIKKGGEDDESVLVGNQDGHQNNLNAKNKVKIILEDEKNQKAKNDQSDYETSSSDYDSSSSSDSESDSSEDSNFPTKLGNLSDEFENSYGNEFSAFNLLRTLQKIHNQKGKLIQSNEIQETLENSQKNDQNPYEDDQHPPSDNERYTFDGNFQKITQFSKNEPQILKKSILTSKCTQSPEKVLQNLHNDFEYYKAVNSPPKTSQKFTLKLSGDKNFTVNLQGLKNFKTSSENLQKLTQKYKNLATNSNENSQESKNIEEGQKSFVDDEKHRDKNFELKVIKDQKIVGQKTLKVTSIFPQEISKSLKINKTISYIQNETERPKWCQNEEEKVDPELAKEFNIKSCSVNINRMRGVIQFDYREHYFVCFECDTVFLSLRNLVTHYKCLHSSSETPYKCYKCLAAFKILTELLNHLKAHDPSYKVQPYLCKFCFKLFNNNREVYNHIYKNHHKNEKFKCLQCPIKFKNSNLLKEHLKISHPPIANLRYDCEICKSSFVYATSYEDHMLKAHGEKLIHKCMFCEEKFKKKNDLESHYKTHTNLVKMKCKECQKDVNINPQFILKNEAKGESDFRCILCANQAKNKQKELESLIGVRNNKRNSGKDLFQNFPQESSQSITDKPKTLPLKSKLFENRPKLIKPGDQQIKMMKVKCYLCDREMPSNLRLFWHIKEHLSLNFKCPTCEFEFDNRLLMFKHCKIAHKMQIFTRCKICSTKISATLINAHMKYVHKINHDKIEKEKVRENSDEKNKKSSVNENGRDVKEFEKNSNLRLRCKVCRLVMSREEAENHRHED